MIIVSIGERITELRNKQDMSQAELARAMDVSRQAVSKWENDQTAPDTIKLILLAEVLNTEVEYLATGRTPAYQQPPVVVNVVKTEEKIVEVEKIIERPVVRKITRIKYVRNPVEYAAVCAGGLILGLIIGMLL